MPERGDGIQPEVIAKEVTPKPANFEFKDSADIEEYLAWKQEVPTPVRRIVESALKGATPVPSASGLPLTDQFLNAMAECVAS